MKKRTAVGLVGLAALAAGGTAHFAPRTIEGEIVTVKTPQCARVWTDAYAVDCELDVELDSGDVISVDVTFDGRLPGACQPYSPLGAYFDPHCPKHKAVGTSMYIPFDYEGFEQSKEAAEYVSANLVEGNRLKMVVVRDSIFGNNFRYKLGTGFTAWDAD